MGREPIVTQADRLEAERSSHANTTLAGEAFLESPMGPETTRADDSRRAHLEIGRQVIGNFFPHVPGSL